VPARGGREPPRERHAKIVITQGSAATIDYKGKLIIYDIEKGTEKFNVQAHSSMGNVIDGIGGKGSQFGAPELVTGGSDGCVRVWDPR